MKQKLLLVILFALAFGERVFFDLGPNVELVTFALIIAASYLGKKQAFWLTFSILALTDLVIGNSNIFIFTWSGFLIPAFLVGRVFHLSREKGVKKVAWGSFAGIASNLFFFFWTNFGVWLLTNMYTKDPGGLFLCYVNGLPFLRMQLVGTLAFVPLGFILVEMAISVGKLPKTKKVLL